MNRTISRSVLAVLLLLTVLCSVAKAVTEIKQGGLYTGLSGDVFINTSERVTIDESYGITRLTNFYGGVYGPAADIEVRDSRFQSNASTNAGDNSTSLVYFLKTTFCVFWNCFFNGQVQEIGTLCAGGLVINGAGASGNIAITLVNCVFVDCSPAVQLQGVHNDPLLGLYGLQVIATGAYIHNDQISLYDVTGVPGGMIEVVNCLVSVNSDGKIIQNAGGIVPDWNSGYIMVAGNTLLNCGTGSYYSNGNTDRFESNTIVGLGYRSQYSYALAIWKGGGYATNNTVLWVPGAAGGQAYYLGNAGPGNNPAPTGNDKVGDTGQVLLDPGLLTKQYEADLYNSWLTQQDLGGLVYPSELAH